MKIAILTLPLHTNYGGILQAYALQTVLQRMGHSVDVLHNLKVYLRPWYLMPLVYFKRIVKKLLKDRNTPIFAEQKHAQENMIISQYTNKFINNYVKIRGVKSLKEIDNQDYDAFVVGSDQIWRKAYFKHLWKAPMADAFLHFTKGWNIKRIAYAASFGKDDLNEYTDREINICARALQNFDFVSTRESSGCSICKDKLDTTAECCLDPTMLLKKEDYIYLINDNTPSEGNMFCYVLDSNKEKENLIKVIASKYGLKPFNVNAAVDDLSIPAKNRVQPPVESWLKGFRDSQLVVTDSFHACVFSIIFNKPFLVIGNKERGLSRFHSLLKMFGQELRLIIPDDDDKIYISRFNIDKIIIESPNVEDNIDMLRKESISLLQTNLTEVK